MNQNINFQVFFSGARSFLNNPSNNDNRKIRTFAEGNFRCESCNPDVNGIQTIKLELLNK